MKSARKRLAVVAGLGMGMWVASCGGGGDVAAVDCSAAGSAATYNGNVKAFLEKHCTECHASSASLPWQRKGAPSGVDYDTLDLAREHAAAGAAEVAEGSMPPEGGAADLTQDERCLLQAWVNAGRPD